MRILTRYVLREYVVPLSYCLTGFVSIYILFEMFGSFSRLTAAKPGWEKIVRYFAGYLAPYFEWLAPACLMLATLYTMWNFCRHSELVAMRASGIGFFAIVKPLLFVAALMAVFVAYVNEVFVPANAQWAKQFRDARFSEVTRPSGSTCLTVSTTGVQMTPLPCARADSSVVSMTEALTKGRAASWMATSTASLGKARSP